MALLIENALPVVMEGGLNTNKNIDFSGATTVLLPAGTTIGGSSLTALGTITSTSATALAVGRQGTTHPAFNVDASAATQLDGLNVAGLGAGNGATVAVITSGTNSPLTIDAAGSGTITLNGTGTGNIITGATLAPAANQNITATSGTGAFDFSAASGVFKTSTGINTIGGATVFAANKGVTVTGGTSAFDFSGGTGIFKTSTGAVTLGGAVTATSSVLSTSASGGIGYATGAGGAVTQITSRTTGVTLSKITGAITLVSAAGSATPATFTVTNTAVAATDTIIVNQKSGTDLYEIFVTAVGAGSFNITSFTTGGTTTEQPVFNFAVIKGVAA